MKQQKKMNNDTNALKFCLVLIIFLSLFQCFRGYYEFPNVEKVDTVFQTKTDTLWKDTVLHDTVPQLKWKYVLKRDTFYTKEGKDTVLTTEHKQYQDTITCDEDSIIVVSNITGINPTLDSLRVQLKKQEIIKTNTITVTKYIEKPKSHFNIGPSITSGYDLVNKQWGIVAGLGFTITF